eukprot:747752-Hanusia_phi.AAC.2
MAPVLVDLATALERCSGSIELLNQVMSASGGSLSSSQVFQVVSETLTKAEAEQMPMIKKAVSVRRPEGFMDNDKVLLNGRRVIFKLLISTRILSKEPVRLSGCSIVCWNFVKRTTQGDAQLEMHRKSA